VYSIDDLVYRTNPLQIFLSSEQKLILSSVDDIIELTEDNFAFGGNDSKESEVRFHFDLSSVICLGLLVGCVGLFGCVTKLNNEEDSSPSYTDKDSPQDTLPMIIVDNLQEENGNELKQKLSSDFDSFLFSSSDSEGEEDLARRNGRRLAGGTPRGLSRGPNSGLRTRLSGGHSDGLIGRSGGRLSGR
jgi:hypothetical protein